MIAFLTDNAKHAWVDIAADFDVIRAERARGRGVIRKAGEDVDFVVITRQEQLRGSRLSDYVIVGRPDSRLVDLARAYVR